MPERVEPVSEAGSEPGSEIALSRADRARGRAYHGPQRRPRPKKGDDSGGGGGGGGGWFLSAREEAKIVGLGNRFRYERCSSAALGSSTALPAGRG